jgi:hypothetical protein
MTFLKSNANIYSIDFRASALSPFDILAPALPLSTFSASASTKREGFNSFSAFCRQSAKSNLFGLESCSACGKMQTHL